jgi:hypothetical protein
MPENEPQIQSTGDFQLDMLVADMETRFAYAENAMAELHSAIRRIKTYRPSTLAAAAPTRPPVDPDASLWAEKAVPQAEPEQHPADDEAKREEVSRMVAEARAEMKPTAEDDDSTVGIPFWPGPKKAEPEEEKRYVEDYGVDSTSEGSWPIARQPEAKPVNLTDETEVVPEKAEATGEWSTDADDEAKREEVARIVANMRDDDDSDDDQASVESEPEDDEAEKRRDVAKMVADLRGGIDLAADSDEESASDEPPFSDNGDDEARRQEVARMVAQMREGGDVKDEPVNDGADEDESAREDVANMVARMRSEMDRPDETPAEEGGDEAVRDEVRRAVEAARAEMSSGYKHAGDDAEGGKDGASRFSFPDWQSTHTEPSGPPVIVIKDSEGKVELARVYETLSKVNCDENAALLNYTPHSVTVGLNVRTPVPEVEDLTEAVRSVFGRDATVDSDGVRVNVQIGKELKGKNSAA